MSLINSLFNKKTEEFSRYWIPLVSINQLDLILKNSEQKTQIIFKHSVRCYISKSVLKGFEIELIDFFTLIDFYFLDLIKYRELSNSVSSTFNVVHQSPQVLIIRSSKAVASFSHSDILGLDLKKYL